MANLQERRDKSGKLISYSIRVHRGRGADGKQLKPWTATFEKECREGVTSDSRLRFEEYCNYVIGLKEQRGIKHSTIVRYRELTERLYPLPLGSAFGSGKSSGRKQQLTPKVTTKNFRDGGRNCILNYMYLVAHASPSSNLSCEHSALIMIVRTITEGLCMNRIELHRNPFFYCIPFVFQPRIHLIELLAQL